MYKVLLVDDEPLILNGLKDLIDWDSLDIEIAGEASCGIDALEILMKCNIDILITDIRMSYMDGLELIANLRQRHMTTKVIVLSGYDDFNYIKEAVKYGIENYLLKPVSESELITTLNTVIKKLETNLYQMDMLKSNFLIHWTSNTIENSELIDKANFLNIDLSCRNYVAIIIKMLNNVEGDRKTSNKHRLEKIILEKMSPSLNPLLFKDLDGNYVLCLSNFTQEQYDYICNTVIPSCIFNINSYLNIHTFVAVGSIEPSYESLSHSYSSAKQLLEYRLVMPIKAIVTHQEIDRTTSANQKLLHIDYSQLKNYILIKNTDKMTEWIDDVFMKISESTNLKPLMLKNVVLEILFITISTIKSIDSDMNVLNDYPDLYLSVLELNSMNDFRVWLKYTLTNIMDSMGNIHKKNGSLIEAITAYIQENYSKNINLDVIATEFDKNPAYIGQLFKKEYGESFTNHINKIRIDRAKSLLISNPALTTMDISNAVGYYNTNYFYTVFKKLIGVTPSEFKSNLTLH